MNSVKYVSLGVAFSFVLGQLSASNSTAAVL